MNIQTMNNIGDLETSLLGFLLDKSRHGYELHRLVTDRRGFGGVWRLKIGNLYAMLNKLHEAELVSVKITSLATDLFVTSIKLQRRVKLFSTIG